MKKALTIMIGLLLVVGVAFAGLDINDRKSFSATGNAGTATIDKGNGKIVCETMTVWCDTNKALTIYRPDIETTVHATNSLNTTNITLFTSVSNKVEGYTLTASDSILIADTSVATTNWYFAGIASVGAVTTNSKGQTVATAYTLDDAVYYGNKDVVYILKNAENLAYSAFETQKVISIDGAFTGHYNKPVHLRFTSGAGANAFATGTVTIQK